MNRLPHHLTRRPLVVCPPQPQQVPIKLDDRCQGVLNVFVNQHLAPELGKRPSERDDIPYLPPVQILPGELVDVHEEVAHVDTLANLDALGEVPSAVLEHVEEVAPDASPLLLVQPVIAQGEVNAAFEGLVKRAHSVGREDQDAVVVFQETEEN